MKDAYIPHYDVKSLILKETFKMLLVRNPESITVAELESAIGFTRGSIFYHMKNKKEIIELAMSTHLCSSFNPYFPVNSLHIKTLKQYIEAKINHLFDMGEKDKQQWEKILNMAVANREIETAMDIKQLASVFCDSYTGYLIHDFGQRQDIHNNSLYSLYELIKRKY